MTKRRPVVPERVKKLRAAAHLPMREFAGLFSDNPQHWTIFNLEYGYGASDRVLDAIAGKCNVSREWLLGEDVPLLISPPPKGALDALKKGLKAVGVNPNDLKLGSEKQAVQRAVFKIQSVLLGKEGRI